MIKPHLFDIYDISGSGNRVSVDADLAAKLLRFYNTVTGEAIPYAGFAGIPLSEAAKKIEDSIRKLTEAYETKHAKKADVTLS
jgi:hypothetical protein